jgi:hypothetical protein
VGSQGGGGAEAAVVVVGTTTVGGGGSVGNVKLCTRSESRGLLAAMWGGGVQDLMRRDVEIVHTKEGKKN